MENKYYWKGLLESVTLIVTYRTVLPLVHACFTKVTFPFYCFIYFLQLFSSGCRRSGAECDGLGAQYFWKLPGQHGGSFVASFGLNLVK